LLATGAILFRRGDFKAKAGKLDDKTRWLFGEGADAAFELLDGAEIQLPVRRAFTHGGYYVLGCDFESVNEIRLIADAGPLGYETIAAHGHADALAFTLSVGGRSSSSIRGPTLITRKARGVAIFAVPPPTTPCATTAWTSRSPAETSCG
jgi:hypothetical protein